MRLLCCLLCLCFVSLQGGYTVRNGKIVNQKDLAKYPVQEHLARGVAFVEEKKWKKAEMEFRILCKAFPDTPFANTAEFYWAVCDYNQKEYEFANEHLDRYLQSEANPQFFTDAIELKFSIAEQFRKGKKRRLFGKRQLPKIVSGRTRALDLYDEVISAYPGGELACKALFSKGELLKYREDYEGAIEEFKNVTRQFPTQVLALNSFISIADCYLLEAKKQSQNPDLLSRAELNARKFEEAFPAEPRVEDVYRQVAMIQEIYAQGLVDTAEYYERKKKPQAAIVYYYRAIEKFPDSNVASVCQERLEGYGQSLPALQGIALSDQEGEEQL